MAPSSTEYNHDGRRVWVTSRYAVAVSPLLLNAGRTTGVPRKPVVMTYFLAFATGARLLESQMAKRPGYLAYMERTSMFLPRPPKRS